MQALHAMALQAGDFSSHSKSSIGGCEGFLFDRCLSRTSTLLNF